MNKHITHKTLISVRVERIVVEFYARNAVTRQTEITRECAFERQWKVCSCVIHARCLHPYVLASSYVGFSVFLPSFWQPILAVVVASGAWGTTTTSTEKPNMVLSLSLTGYDDQYYAVSVTVGMPGWNFMLVWDPTIDGVVVAYSQYKGSSRPTDLIPYSPVRITRHTTFLTTWLDGIK